MLILLTLLSISAYALFDDPNFKHAKAEEINGLVEDPDYMTMTVIYVPESQASILLNTVLEDLMPKFSNYVKFLSFDCTDEPGVCNEEMIEKLPVFQGYVPAGLNPYTGKPLVHSRGYQGLIAAKEISEYFNTNIPYLGETLSKETNEAFLNEESNKVILFTNKEKVPIIYRGLSSKYRGFLDFGLVKQQQTDLLEHYDIKDFPSLIVIEKNDIIKYKGKIDFNEISEFLEKYKSPTKKAPKLKKTNTAKQQPPDNAKLPEFPIISLGINGFNEMILEENSLYLVQFYKDKMSPEWDEITKDYNGIVKLATFQCKNKEEIDFCGKQGVKKYPSIRIYPVNKKRKPYELIFDNRKDLEEEISRELRFDITNVQEATIQTFINSVQEEQRIGCMLVAEGPLPMTFKGLAAEQNFKEFVRFAYFSKSEEQARAILTLKKYPTIFAFIKSSTDENLQVIEYNGDFNDYRSLYYFFDQNAIPMLLNKKPTKMSEVEQEEIDIIHDGLDLNSRCLRKSGLCVIGLFEGNVIFK